METNQTQTPIQKIREEIGSKLRHLPEYKVIELCQDYGITYSIADADSLRIFMLLCAAEELILAARADKQ